MKEGGEKNILARVIIIMLKCNSVKIAIRIVVVFFFHV